MAMTATTNTSANTALRYLNQNSAASASSLSKLSSGSRIVRASDDAASLAVGTKIKADVTALKQAQVNAGQASSLLQVADGGFSQVSEILLRMKALSVQAQSGSISDNERGFLDQEFQALAAQIDDISAQTKFNGTTLLDGSLAGSTIDAGGDNGDIGATGTVTANIADDADAGTYTIAYSAAGAAPVPAGGLTVTNTTTGASQTIALDNAVNSFNGSVEFDGMGVTVNFTGHDLTVATGGDIAANNTFDVTAGGTTMDFQVGVASADSISVTIDDIRTTALGDGTNFIDTANITNQVDAVTAGDTLDAAIAQLNSARASTGAMISRFEFASANLATSIENLDAARSVLLDVDMAAEMSNFSSKQVLLQASVAMLAQANQQPQQLLQLLQ